MDSQMRVPPAHDRFVAHFTDPIYLVDDPGSYDELPFGTDDGADVVHEWSTKVDILLAKPTLEQIVVSLNEPDGPEGRASEDDEYIVAAGFTLLRYTGQIDRDGRRKVLESLERLYDDEGSDALATMISDLRTFGKKHSGKGKAAQTRRWLWIETDHDDPKLKRWLTGLRSSIDSDEEWRTWWSSSPVPRLQFCIAFHPLDSDFYFAFKREGGDAGSWGTTEELWTRQVSGKRNAVGIADPHLQGVLRELVHALCVQAAQHLGMNPPPPDLPTG